MFAENFTWGIRHFGEKKDAIRFAEEVRNVLFELLKQVKTIHKIQFNYNTK